MTEPTHAEWERYGVPIDMERKDDSRVLVLDALAEAPQRILELGPSIGLMTEVLTRRGHEVTGIEIDAEAAEAARGHAHELIVGDLETADDSGAGVLDRFEDGYFDTLIAADVLEHLREPTAALRSALRCVRPEGDVVLSIPNVAHGDVRLRLLAGMFDYAQTGLMDRTHVQMFTLKRLCEMLRDVGLVPVAWSRTPAPLGETELEVEPELEAFGRYLLAGDPEVETYQWVVTCRRADVAANDAQWPDEHDLRPMLNGLADLLKPPPVPEPSVAETATTELIVESCRRLVGYPRRLLGRRLGR